jgi:plastocyanin
MTEQLRSIRLRPIAATVLDNSTNSVGTIYFDNTSKTLRLFDGNYADGVSMATRRWTNSAIATAIAALSAADLNLIITNDDISWIPYAELIDLPSAAANHGMFAHVHGTGKAYYAHAGNWIELANISDLGTAAAQDVGYFATAAQGALADTALQSVSVAFSDLGIADGNVGQVLTTNGAGVFTFEDAASGGGSIGNFTFNASTVTTNDVSSIAFIPAVVMNSDLTLDAELVFSDGTRQSTATLVGPQGDEGPPGPTGSGAGDVSSVNGGYTDNAIVRYNGSTGTSIQTTSATISDVGLLSATSFGGSGTGLTALNASNLGSGTVPDARFPATLPIASGVNLTALNASNLGSGTVPDARFPTTLPATSGTNLTALNATNLGSGTVPDARFPATLPIASGVNLTALNATNLGSGTVPDARFPTTLPATSGVNLTALNASNLGSGTVPVLRLGTAGTRDTSTFLRGDNTWVAVTGSGAQSDSFATITVAGQPNVVADSAADTLTLVAGTGISITTDAGTDTVTFTNTGSVANAFTTISVAGQSDVVADSATDTLTITAGTGINITTNAGTDTVTITSTVSGGATAFTGLSDRADLTVDKFYLPAITMLATTANGASAYRFDQYGVTDNPTVYAINGTTIAFNLNVAGHPFLIQTSGGTNYSTGLVHVSTTGTVLTGASANGQTSGTLYWKVPSSISGNYRYQCSIHGGMVGVITIKDFAVI